VENEVRRAVEAVHAVGTAAYVGRFAALRHAVVLVADRGAAVDVDPGEPGGVTPVDVDAGDHTGGPDGDVVDHHVPLERRAAVAARPVELADALGVEAGD